MKRNQSGFTLVEIAIVLVIIGLLLGGVLKGQELIENTKIKSLHNDINGLATAFNAYRDRYNAIPGDDARALTRGWVFTTPPIAGNGNGVINGNVTFGNPTNEGIYMWQEMRAAGFLTGDMNNQTQLTVQPRSSLGTAMNIGVGQYGLTGMTACVQNIPGKIAYLYDVRYDDGVATTGSIRAQLNGNPASPSNAPTAPAANGASSYSEAGTNGFAVCRSL